MKAGWQTKKLGNVLEIQNGYAFDSKKFNPIKGLPLVRIRSLKNGVEQETFYDGEFDKRYIVNDGDLLIGMDGEFGCFEWRGGMALLNQRVCRLQNFTGELMPRFVYYGVNDYLKAIEEVTGFATVKHLSSKQVLAIEFPVPSVNEQQRIVTTLDAAFADIATAKANAEKNLQSARALFDSYLNQVFTERGEGWVEKRLDEICDIKHGYAFEGAFFCNQGDYVLLTPGNFYEVGGYRDRGEKQKYYIGEIPHDYVLNQGDLLVAMTEQAAGLLGSPILVPESDRFLHNQRLGLVTPKSCAAWSNEFFFYVFNTQHVRTAIQDSASGVKVRHTSPTKIGQVVVTFPTMRTEQRRIVAIIASLTEETQRLESIYQQKLTAFDELKKSLLHQAFSGQL